MELKLKKPMPPSLPTVKAVRKWRRMKGSCGFVSGTRSRIGIQSGKSEVSDGSQTQRRVAKISEWW